MLTCSPSSSVKCTEKIHFFEKTCSIWNMTNLSVHKLPEGSRYVVRKGFCIQPILGMGLRPSILFDREGSAFLGLCFVKSQQLVCIHWTMDENLEFPWVFVSRCFPVRSQATASDTIRGGYTHLATPVARKTRQNHRKSHFTQTIFLHVDMF